MPARSQSRGKTGEALFFMRAGFTGVQKHCPLLWAGDQSVDFTRHDGLVTVISRRAVVGTRSATPIIIPISADTRACSAMSAPRNS